MNQSFKNFSLVKKTGRPNYYVRMKDNSGNWFFLGSTGTNDKKQAEKIAMQWILNGKTNETVESESLVNQIKKTDFTKDEVKRICENFKKRGLLTAYAIPGTKQDVSFIAYMTEYYSKTSKARQIDDNRIVGATVYNAMLLINKYWKPYFKDIPIVEVTDEKIKDFKYFLQQKTDISDSSKRTTLSYGLATLRQARRDGLIDVDIASCVRNFKAKCKKRAILSPEQVEVLFKSEWRNNKEKLGNILACVTGMRSGEVSGLQKEDLRMIDGKYFIQVRHSYSRNDGLKGTKTNNDELIPIVDDGLMKMLMFLAETNPVKSGYVFWSDRNPNVPMSHTAFYKGLKEQLKKLGFSESAKTVNFHSWRHYNRTMLTAKGKVNSSTLSKITGHSVKMIDNLYSFHFTETDYEEYTKGIKAVFDTNVNDYFGITDNLEKCFEFNYENHLLECKSDK